MKQEFLNRKNQTGSKQRIRGQPWKRAAKSSALLAVILIGLGSIIATGGGGGSSTGDVSALTLPDKILLTQVEDGSSPAASLSTAGRAFNDPGTDYSTQTKNTWIEDTDALDMVNGILGACEGTRYENFVNAGPYKALVEDVGKAKQSEGGASTSSTTSEQLMEMTVDVSRANNSAPMIVKIWVKVPDGPGNRPMLVRGYFVVTEGVSAQYPYGVMEAHFKGNMLNTDGTEGDEVLNMAMSINADDAGNIVVQFIETCNEVQQNYQSTDKVSAVANSTLTTGKAYAYEYENSPWDGESELTSYFAFNADYFKVDENGTEKVYDKNNFVRRVFRYKLFNKDTGALVTRNSGFPIQLSTGEHVYVGYWGLWAPYGVDVANNATVTKVETGEEYTVFKKRGKLRKHTSAQITLSELVGVEMSYWKDGTDSIITWDGTNFNKIGTRNNENGQIEYQDLGAVTFNEWEGAWCEALNAYLPLGRLYAGGGAPDNSSTVKYHKEDTVTPAVAVTLGDLTLYYWGYAPDPFDASNISDTAEDTYWSSPATEKTYFFDSSELVLKETDVSGNQVIIPESVDLSQTRYQCGFHMCPMTTNNTYDNTNWWQIHDEPTYYSWETGPNEWNQFATVKDSNGDPVAFDAPLRFSYTHSTANDLNGDATYDGKKFNIEYDGSELHIPWEFDATVDEWLPVISLKDGTTLDTDYVVKATEEALFMQEASDPSLAISLTIDTTIAPPTLAYDASKTTLVGALPTDAELKVIKGELL